MHPANQIQRDGGREGGRKIVDRKGRKEARGEEDERRQQQNWHP